MNPTKEEVDQLIRQCEADGDFYRDLRNHNRAIARERISKYRATVDDLTETRVTGQHMAFVGDGRKRLEMVLSNQKLSIGRRFLRWLKKWSDRT